MIQRIKALFNRSATFKRYRSIVYHGGWGHLFRRRFIERKILDTRPILTKAFTSLPGTQCEVHILTRGTELRMALWAAKTFYRYSEVDWPLVWHQGGSLSTTDRSLIAKHFPNSHAIPKEYADRVVGERLQSLKLLNCGQSRQSSVMMRKLLDCLLLSSAENLMILDSDILFFRRPDEIIEAGQSQLRNNVFGRDSMDWPYNITAQAAKDRYGLQLVSGLNAGMSVLRRESFNLDLIEEFLQDPDIMSYPWWTEQTLHAILASKMGVRFLPDTYKLSFDAGLATLNGQPLKAKHYAGFPRPHLYEEGMRELINCGFLESLTT